MSSGRPFSVASLAFSDMVCSPENESWKELMTTSSTDKDYSNCASISSVTTRYSPGRLRHAHIQGMADDCQKLWMKHDRAAASFNL